MIFLHFMKVKRFCSFQNITWIFRFHVSNLTKYLTAFTSLVIFRFLNISLMSHCCIKKIILQKGRLGLTEMVVKFWPKKNIENIHFIQWFISITLGCQHFWECIKNQWSNSYLFWYGVYGIYWYGIWYLFWWWKWYYKTILNNNNNSNNNHLHHFLWNLGNYQDFFLQ